MRVKESTLRRIIREEAHRALREQVTPAPAPAAGTPPVPAPVTPAPVASAPTTTSKPAALTVDQAAPLAYKQVNSLYKTQMLALWEQYLKVNAAGSKSVVNFEFQINVDGKVDPKTIKVTCKPDLTRTVAPNPPTTFSSELKKMMTGWKFQPASEPFIYEHPKAMEFGS
jgi:hypothetical protein